jgi:DNA replication protein DnaC
LTNEEYERAETLARLSGIPLDECPTCGSKPQVANANSYGREYGTYKYRGKEHDCDCDEQMQLRKHYLVANIPTQYQELDFADYSGTDEVKEEVEGYLKDWAGYKGVGVGVEFTGVKLGTGKTFMATHIGKELIKLGEAVYFTQFREVLSAYEKEYVNGLESLMRDTTVLILDEVIPPFSEKSSAFFAHKFEELIRHRTNFNLPTIMTTNLPEEKLRKEYPRPYSLLEAKQIRVVVDGDDARESRIGFENIEIAQAGEKRPIT